MAKKIKLTRPELKRYRDALARFERYLPMLKLKQQQLQTSMRQIEKERRAAQAEEESARAKFNTYSVVMRQTCGVDLNGLAEPEEVKTTHSNIAGVNIPVFQDISFPRVSYSLFATPAWVDQALLDLRSISSCKAKVNILDQQYELIQKELTKIIQRVNLFEKVKIPEAKEAIRVIRIQLGDEMTAAVGRAKIAKGKLEKLEAQKQQNKHKDGQQRVAS